jgi:2-phosphoglycerate kinase
MNKRSVILIGGAPLSGKSTLAKSLSKKLDIPWVSTDDIRKWMQAIARKEDYPGLFYSIGLDAVAFYKKHQTAQSVVDGEVIEGLDVQKGVIAMIDSFWWWDKFIIEGIAISPSFIMQFQESHKDIDVTPIFLVDKDRDNIKKRIGERGLWDKAGTYPDYIKPLELEWVVLYNQHYEQEVSTAGFEIHEISELHKLEKLFTSSSH